MKTKQDQAAYDKAYCALHREEIRVRKKGYYAAHREEARASCKAWREANPEHRSAHHKAWREAHREELTIKKKVYYDAHRKEAKIQRLLRKYGLVLGAFEAALQDQGGKCASCNTSNWGPNGPVVDHNHTTHTVRGILCHACNMSEGLLKDSARARALANYMKRYGL